MPVHSALARLLCAVAFVVQILLPAAHAAHGAHGHDDGWRDGTEAAASHDAGDCTLCAALAAAHHGVGIAVATLAAPPAVGDSAAPSVAPPVGHVAPRDAAPRAPPRLVS